VSGSEHKTLSLKPWNSADAAATSSSDICTVGEDIGLPSGAESSEAFLLLQSENYNNTFESTDK
jgi:hypothetical protein